METTMSPEAEARLEAVMGKVQELAVLPHVVFKVLEISADSANAAGVEMEKAIIVDPGFSSKVLTRANSAAYGLPRKVTSIKEAITFLGYRALRNMAMTVGVFDLFVGKTDKESLRRRSWWRHSIDAAVSARWLARETRVSFPEEAYTCGLLHLMGKTLLDRLDEFDYDAIEAAIAAGESDVDAERRLFGVDHMQIGMGAAAKWRLPFDLVAGLAYAEPAPEDDPVRELRALTSMGNFIAGTMRTGWSGGADDARIPAWACQILKIPGERIDGLVQTAQEVVAQANQQ